MIKKENITSDQKIAAGENMTDWERLDSMTEEEIEANALSDSDNPPMTRKELEGLQLVPSLKSIISKTTR